MTTYKYYVGLEDKDTSQVSFSSDVAMLMLAKSLCQNHEGLTLQKSRGVYKYNNGTYAFEPTILITLFNDLLSEDELKTIKEMFNQESIAVEKYESEILFI